MRCLACNTELTNQEVRRRGKATGEYFDLCNHCYEPIADVAPVATTGDDVLSEGDEREFDELVQQE